MQVNLVIGFKILLIGESCVGKTALFKRFIRNLFSIETPSTIGIEFESKKVFIDDKAFYLQVWDTCRFSMLQKILVPYTKNSNGVVIVYDVTSKQSFQHVQSMFTSLKEVVDENVVILLVGNRCDDVDRRVVTYEEGKQLAESLNMLFFETSAKESSNAETAFITLAKEIKTKFEKKGENYPLLRNPSTQQQQQEDADDRSYCYLF